ncbi:MATE family efflux transporter [Pygmaiobacter massiliensis]|uniref:MATE family efflux transporter n=1 Tax=Pygmaiobacter massiliensis TaxID=1917873 RepID=UPI000C7C467E|nr:MATE family efflux transporter [Pygmaiobacter massiliensis]
MKKINDLGRDSMLGLVLRLAIPSMIAQLVNVLYCIIDRMYIGNIPEIGTLALAGVGVCGPIVTLLSSFGTLVGIGGSILMAMKLGEGDEKTAKQVLSNSFLLLLIFSGLLTVSFLLLKDYLLTWFGASDVTFIYADTYMTIYTLGTFFALLAIGLGSFITCQGFANISMTAVLIGAGGNILLDTVFVLVLNWGVAGAAWATVLSQMASCLFSVLFLFRSRRIRVRISFGGYSSALIKRILSIGVSPFLILATDSVLLIAMNAMLKKYGGPTEGDLLITAVTIVQSFMMLVTGPMIGATGGTQAIISYNYGARQTGRVRQAERYILSLCLIFTSLMFLVSRTASQYFVGIFTQDPETVALAVWGIRVFTLAIVPLSLQYTFVDGLTALGCTRVSLFLSLSRKTIFLLCVILLPPFFSARAAFYAEPICDIIGAINSSILFLITFRPHLVRRETASV